MTAAGADDLVIRIDGREPVTAAGVEQLLRLCDRAEDGFGAGVLVAYTEGAPGPGWTGALSVGLTSKWERAVRRVERLGLTTVAVAAGDVGGAALDVLLAADVRIAATGSRLILASDGEATWPGMALFRLARQAGAAGLRRAALLGAPIGAATAMAAGLVDVVTDRPADALADVVTEAAGFAGTELAIRRQLLLDAGRISFEEALGAHLAACDRALRRGTVS
ncbi:enoyl-CoA-hydratase DpgB [Actinoplanes rectilineatus]|uniref:enoyl-CoA-hydratase DpgB n=1 Tax=Actinoplanes rectilineatus TaxID=113571 RepID=UPI000A40CD1F|nr:enoyl-CoA-hydratase DpgB [Actinoplanes rectilineatus]